MLVADRQQTLEEYLLSVEARIDEVVAEILALRAENAELRAFKASVPWKLIQFQTECVGDAGLAHDADIIQGWLDANAPKEAAE